MFTVLSIVDAPALIANIPCNKFLAGARISTFFFIDLTKFSIYFFESKKVARKL
jgi:hypothetical protein